MAGPRGARLPVGSAPWVAEERSSALQIAQQEVEEFSFSARNDFDWLNEHMAEIFSENQINVAEIFKTPGKLRGKTPRTVRRANATENRVPLSDIFSATPKGAHNPFVIPNMNRSNTPRFEIAADPQPSPPKQIAPASPSKITAPKPTVSKQQPPSVIDSGYHGSQSQDAMDIDNVADEITEHLSLQANTQGDYVGFYESPNRHALNDSVHNSLNPTLETNVGDVDTQYFTAHVAAAGNLPTKNDGTHESTTPAGSPLRSPEPASPKDSPAKSAVIHTQPEDNVVGVDGMETVMEEPSRSSSDTSSPIRPIVRKSSLNFASLPAREPITHKSIGNRVSRTSHLEQNRTSYYNRHTGGKSLGHAKHDLSDEENDDDDMDVDEDEDEDPLTQKSQSQQDRAATQNKTYTQRLQDQISKLGQSQAPAPRSSKSIPDPFVAQPAAVLAPSQDKPLPSPKKTTTPGAFPEDDEDDWIQPLGSPENASDARSPRPGLAKSYTADVMEGVSGKETAGGNDFAVPKTRQRQSRSKSPERPPMSERAPNNLGHHKSVSVPMLPTQAGVDGEGDGLKKTISVSNPPLATVSENERPTTPIKSPSRGFKDSPLRQVKSKLSSILKSSKGLLASSAAISAEGKTSLLSPSTTRLGLHPFPSSASLVAPQAQPLYPDLSRHAADNQTLASVTSPTRAEGRRTRASIEREKAEEKRKEKEAKEARRMAEQMEKLEKAREKEREKARVFSKEQERVAAMEKQLAAQKEQEKRAAVQTPGNPSKSTRSSPRKAKPQPAAEEEATVATVFDDKQIDDDIDMVDAPNPMPPPSAPRSAAPPSATKGREIKRPMRPAKEPASKTKQAPTVIRVNMGSQHPQYHPSNNALSSNLQETLSQPQPKNKPNQLQSKPSLQSLKSSTSSSGRPKALEAAARRKEQEEREAQRKRDAKAELERKRAAIQEEEKRQEQQRKEEERKQAEAKKNAQRQAMLEKAKQTRAPPPAARSQPNGPPDYSRAEPAAPRPPSRLATNAQRSQEDTGRPVNALLSNASKASTKRPLQQEHNDDNVRQPPARGGTGYQPKDPKRMRMTDEFDDDGEREKQPSLKGAPVRPSGGYKKDMPTKSMYQAGYTNASNANRDLFKTTVTNQHNSQMKAAHPLDMAQVSKAHIPFAPNPNPAGPSYKTPARPQGVAATKSTAKSATRSSPRFQNGESIELPEINTDDEDDEYDDGGKDTIASWADSPNLRQALVEQEAQDPFQVFGAPGPLNMEEVFAKSKDRFHKFRARTSSANWSGPDRLTDEDIRKDLAARDKIRREGGWTYEMSRDMV
ncbi:uncharacterized protein F4822DRAFT_409703 [Hypoxylon trugodes]|uniref:uncharacterized protein n=1 Tax=Hypoxylon trugodes TaxID=326681 RepID=UPI002197C0A5|nr:uncharacterized protein F4822DRAFT_409703 [Hypoxylon trugodes]KAI1386342.1 hypothetical protein F4822DRAFT_409703 [Hypoxylon trugodes]